jgi:hypothetical protein
MTAKSTIIVASSILFCVCAGCGDARKSSIHEEAREKAHEVAHEEAQNLGVANENWIREVTKGLNEMADLLSTITDVASYEAAKPKLKVLYDAQRERNKNVIWIMTWGQRKAWWDKMKSSPDYPKHQEAAKRYLHERNKLSHNHEVYDRLANELILPAYRVFPW